MMQHRSGIDPICHSYFKIAALHNTEAVIRTPNPKSIFLT